MKESLQQVLIVMFQLALYHSLESLGLKVVGAFGHSLGEYAAVCVAGVVTVEEVLKIVFERALLIEQHGKTGKMLSVSMSEEDILSSKYSIKSSIQVACINSQNNCVLAGDPEDIDALHSTLKMDGVHVKILDSMRFAYHHKDMLRVGPKFSVKLHTLTSRTEFTTTKMLITSLKDRCKIYHPGSKFELDYFLHHLYTPVDFTQTIKTLQEYRGISLTIVESGVKSTLKALSPSFYSWIPNLMIKC